LFNDYSRAGEEWAREREQLRNLLTEEEYTAARASTTNAHYTSPEVISAIWDAVRRLGFDGGRMLEPSAGIGHFIGLMPSDLSINTRKTAIELDPISGRILKQLYQNADVRIQGFENLKGLNNFYDLAISNVPFGDYKVDDPAYRKYNLNIHNYFITKMLDKVRPGGIVAAITSSHTLDAYDSQIRKNFADRGDFLGAIRLPNNAFKKNAGTEVTTDILFFRKRGSDEKAAGEPFLKTKTMELADKPGYTRPAEVNQYFDAHPEMALGEHSMKGTMYGGGEYALVAKPDQDTPALLNDAIQNLPENAMRAAKVPDSVKPSATYDAIPEYGDTKMYGLKVQDGKVFRRMDEGMVHQADFPKDRIQPLKKMLELRDTARNLFQAEARGDNPDELTRQRGVLNRLYDSFVQKYGPLHDNRRAMPEDDDLPFVLALEKWNAKKGEATKSDAFTKATVAPRKPIEHVDTAKEALLVSLGDKGRIDFEHMSKLTGQPEESLQNDLRQQGLIFHNPEGHWETTDAYLSGNVRKKLAEATEAAKVDPQFQQNVDALQKIQPPEKPAHEIMVNLGAVWIPESDIEDFIREKITGRGNPRPRVSYVEAEAIWRLNARDFDNETEVTHKWGVTDSQGHLRENALDLLETALSMQQPTIWDRVPGDEPGTEKRVVNQELTLSARDKLEKMQDMFRQWLFSDAERTDRLAKVFNDRYNNSVERQFDGSHLALPGMNAGITMRPAQKNMVARAIYGNNEAAYHEVGTGKTFEAIAIAMEKRRLHLAKKNLVTVPNHMVEQWAKDWRMLYPNANVLAITKDDFAAAKRKEFISRIATGDWDGVILAHSSFGKIPVTTQTEQRYLQKQLDQLRGAPSRAGSSNAIPR